MDLPVCPDFGNTQEPGCYTSYDFDPERKLPVAEWLKTEMKDMLDHEVAHDVDGPALWGIDEDGVPRFYVYRDPDTLLWKVKGKQEPNTPVGLRSIFSKEQG